MTAAGCRANRSITLSLKMPKYNTPSVVITNAAVIDAGIFGACHSVVRSRKNITTISRK